MTPVSSSVALDADRPRMRGWVHAFMCVLALPAAAAVYLAAAPSLRVPVLLYLCGFFLTYGVSAAYHVPPWTPAVRARWRRADHAAIMACVAGSFFPFLFALDPAHALVLSFVVAGTCTSLSAFRFWGRFPRAAVLAYFIPGSLSLVFIPFLASVSMLACVLFTFGILVYAAGSVMFVMQVPAGVPHLFGFHEVFHVLTLIAAFSQMAAIAVLCSLS